MKQRHLLLLGIGLALASCRGEREEIPQPVKKDFTVGYFFINKGDDNIKLLSLQTLTFYPNVDGRVGYNSLQIFDKLYEPVGAHDSIAHVFDAPHMKKTLYPGCITYMKVYIFSKTPVYVRYHGQYVPSNGYHMRVFELPADTVTAAANCTRTFRWPADTLRYKELPYYF